ncbi:hypothetical protein GDO81_010270 [Engystomops pustulosus]|uniref:Uncharacterized protein n=1 Tax=Engystomops pustulosus TaxID=76066 RepID=A0AAV7BZ36_ENGPU|nr:hypothetical protein GDO81_010270 [Engystomops pustulosus]
MTNSFTSPSHHITTTSTYSLQSISQHITATTPTYSLQNISPAHLRQHSTTHHPEHLTHISLPAHTLQNISPTNHRHHSSTHPAQNLTCT